MIATILISWLLLSTLTVGFLYCCGEVSKEKHPILRRIK